jgi:hypothetical protein
MTMDKFRFPANFLWQFLWNHRLFFSWINSNISPEEKVATSSV